MRRLTILSLAAALQLSCSPGHPVGEESREVVPALVPESAFSHSDLGWVTDLAVVGDRIVGVDALLNPSVHLFARDGLQYMASYGRSGDGPGEFRDPEHIVQGVTDAPDVVWILDGVHQRLTRLPLHEMEAGEVTEPETLKLDGPNAATLVRAPDGRWFGGGWITGGRVARYRPDRTYDRTVLGFPPGAEAPGTTLLQAYESRVVVHPAGGQVAAATLLGGILEIFDYDGLRAVRAAVPNPFPPSWVQGRSRSGRAVLSVGDETRFGFTDLTATSRHLYGLFSGRRVMLDGTPWATTEVQVYRWDGTYLRSLHLDREAEAIVVDAADEWLYASGPDPRPWVARFRLPASGAPAPVGASPVVANTLGPG